MRSKNFQNNSTPKIVATAYYLSNEMAEISCGSLREKANFLVNVCTFRSERFT